jgi:hypothetical protein
MSTASEMRPPIARTVGIVVAGTILLTAFHFTDNIVNVDTYPRQEEISATAVQVAALIFWPLFAAFGVIGYLLYRRGRISPAHAYLLAFSFLGLVSLGHFTAASPDKLTTRGLISVIMDAIAGFTVVGTVAWSILARRKEPSASATSGARG